MLHVNIHAEKMMNIFLSSTLLCRLIFFFFNASSLSQIFNLVVMCFFGTSVFSLEHMYFFSKMFGIFFYLTCDDGPITSINFKGNTYVLSSSSYHFHDKMMTHGNIDACFTITRYESVVFYIYCT